MKLNKLYNLSCILLATLLVFIGTANAEGNGYYLITKYVAFNNFSSFKKMELKIWVRPSGTNRLETSFGEAVPNSTYTLMVGETKTKIPWYIKKVGNKWQVYASWLELNEKDVKYFKQDDSPIDSWYTDADRSLMQYQSALSQKAKIFDTEAEYDTAKAEAEAKAKQDAKDDDTADLPDWAPGR
jgi:hypothetical protein